MEDTKQDIDIKVEMEEDVKTKRCPKCDTVLPLSDFYRDKQTKDGLSCWCKACIKARNAQHYQANKDAILQKNAEYRQANKDKKKAYNAEYYQANKDKIAEYKAEYLDPQTHPMNWARNMVKGYRQMDKERGFDTSQTITADWFLDNIAYRPCAHCGLTHFGSIGCNRLDNTKGHTIDNVEPCCFKCNARENIRDQIARGLHVSCKHKKQSFKEFVKEHKKR